MEVSRQPHAPAALLPTKEPLVPIWKGGDEKNAFPAPAENLTAVVQSVA